MLLCCGCMSCFLPLWFLIWYVTTDARHVHRRGARLRMHSTAQPRLWLLCYVASNLCVWAKQWPRIVLGYCETDRSWRFVRDVLLTARLDCSYEQTLCTGGGAQLPCLRVSEVTVPVVVATSIVSSVVFSVVWSMLLILFLYLSMGRCSRENANPPPSTPPEWKRQCVGFSQEFGPRSASDRSIDRSTRRRHVMSMHEPQLSQICDGKKELELGCQTR